MRLKVDGAGGRRRGALVATSYRLIMIRPAVKLCRENRGEEPVYFALFTKDEMGESRPIQEKEVETAKGEKSCG